RRPFTKESTHAPYSSGDAMVKGKLKIEILPWIALILLFVPWTLRAQATWQNVLVSAVIDQQDIIENQPVKVLISVTHDIKDKVDVNSFRQGGAPLKVEFIQDVKISPVKSLVISQYHFNLPGQPVGLYALPEISVKVGGKVYTSIPTTYQVEPF